MNGPLKEAAVTDPKWAKKELRRERLLKVVTAGVLVALTVGVLSVFQNRGQDEQITKIVQTPCQREPAGEECAAIRRAVALREPRANPCVSYQRVTGKRGKNCKRFYVRPGSGGGPSFIAGRGVGEPVEFTSPSGDQGVSEKGGAGRGGSDPQPQPDKGGNDGPSVPPAAPSPAPAGGSPSPTPGNGGGSSSKPAGGATPPPTLAEPPGLVPDLPSTVEAAGEAVGQATEGVQGAVEETGKTVDCVLRGSCP